ncbi:MAG: hypothetical protein GEV11_29085 [Streptosporangiales bacterium]|nr:hypothetical protein [Streptosporangiales bacterium]
MRHIRQRKTPLRRWIAGGAAAMVTAGTLVTVAGAGVDERLDQIKADGGIREPRVEATEGTTANAQSLDMSLRSGPSARERFNCDHGGGWPTGNLLERQGHYGNPANVPDYRN